MKKLLVAALVLVSVIVCHAADSVAQIYKYYDGVFEILQNGSMTLTYSTQLSEPGQNSIESFAYYSVTPYTDENGEVVNYTFTEIDKLDASNPKDGVSVTINDLKAGDVIAFSVDPKTKDKVYSAYYNGEELAAGEHFHHDSGETYHFSKSNNTHTKVLGFTVSSTPDAAPSGQPLPGALTTMLIAGGCAAYLKRRKSSRK